MKKKTTAKAKKTTTKAKQKPAVGKAKKATKAEPKARSAKPKRTEAKTKVKTQRMAASMDNVIHLRVPNRGGFAPSGQESPFHDSRGASHGASEVHSDTANPMQGGIHIKQPSDLVESK